MSTAPSYFYRASPLLDTAQKTDVAGTHYRLRHNPKEAPCTSKFYPSGNAKGERHQPGLLLGEVMTEVEILEERFGPRYFKRGKEAKPEPEPEPESEEPEPDVPELREVRHEDPVPRKQLQPRCQIVHKGIDA